MNKKEVGEIRRHMRRDRSNMTAIYGCYVRANQEIISEFKVSLATLPENEAEKYLTIFKKTLGGSFGKTLNDISFSTRQVADRAPQYAALADLRSCALEDHEQREAFYQRVIKSIHFECNYLILLGHETYDVPFKSKNDDMDRDASDESFTYFICSICPVKDTKPNLHYDHAESTFHDGGMIQAVNAPILGFMFPAFDDRATNLYGALYFNKNTSDAHEDFVEEIFGTRSPRAADDEKSSFNALLHSTLADECSIDVVREIHEQAEARVQLHQEARCADPLTVNNQEIQAVLSACDVSSDAIQRFSDAFTKTFGPDARVNLENIIDTKRYTVTAPDVMIKIAPEKAQNVEMRTIGGLNYIMILADGDVEVNGIQLTPPDGK